MFTAQLSLIHNHWSRLSAHTSLITALLIKVIYSLRTFHSHLHVDWLNYLPFLLYDIRYFPSSQKVEVHSGGPQALSPTLHCFNSEQKFRWVTGFRDSKAGNFSKKLYQYLRSSVSPIIGGKKGRNVYVAPYCDRMWHDSCNIFGFLKMSKKIFKMQPSKHVLHFRWAC